ncbi:rhomboid family intramembrane serine protease [Longispora sp. NPDC051575]|uniref:rhomboid family intramembrane serine protease n=1 Tax=Longispora sp. NPDC051575 TaxID=3154943 RepID=UPI0034452D8C
MTDASPVPTCYRHPGRETYVRCTRCDRPICPDCMTEASVGFQCPSCVAEGRASQPAARTWFGGSHAGQLGYVTMTLIGLNVLVFVISLVISKGGALGGGSLFGGSTVLHDWFAVSGPRYPLNATPCVDNPGYLCGDGTYAPGVDDGAYYRLFTAMFLHFGPIHLLMNMWALWVLGRNLETVFGPARFAALYLLAGIGGNVAVYLFSPNGLSAGASTAIFGMFAALVIVLRKLGRSLAPILPVLVINAIFTFTVSSISIAGHVGGFIAGGVVAAALAYAPQKNRTAIQVAALSAYTLLMVVITLVTAAGRT